MMTAQVFTATILLLMFSPAKPDIAADNKAALLALRDALGGDTLSWGSTATAHLDACSWSGITCDADRNRVLAIRLPGSRLSGRLPPNAIGNLTSLRVLSLRRNSISGQIPPDVASCKQLRVLNLRANLFTGELPAPLFGNLTRLLRVDLAGNQFSGQIPPQIQNLTGLRTLYLEGNHITGPIPNLPPLQRFNVSGNRLTGSVPTALQNLSETAFYGNSLCGKPLPPCAAAAAPVHGAANKLSDYAVSGIVIGVFVILLLIVVIAWIVRRKSGRGKKAATVATLPDVGKVPEPDTSNGNFTESSVSGTAAAGVSGRVDVDGLVFMGTGDKLFDIVSLLEAPAEVLGKGPFGTTYKACLEGSGQVVVLKRLRYANVSELDFKERVERLGETLHVNLCPIIAYFYGKDEKLLIYDHAPMGSLYALLHGGDRVEVTWEMRSAIAIAAARGIEHLHSQGLPHGNIKSTNVLLSNYPAARIAEFGIAQLVTPDGYSDTGDEGLSEKTDIYNFGVLLLELLTRKNPTEDETYLPGLVECAGREKWFTDIIDPELARDLASKEQPMVELLGLALSCASAGFPERRPTMTEVRRQLEALWHVG